jgi:hypothetical protein
MTAHSPVGCILKIWCGKETDWVPANNDINYTDKTGINHDKFHSDSRNRCLTSCMAFVLTTNKSGLI